MAATGKRTLLLVDDEPNVRFAMQDFFAFRGYEVVEACNSQEGLAACERHRPDAALIDYQLPDGDALALLARLRQADAHLPIIVLTGHGTIELAVQAMKRGASHFVTKPVRLPELLKIVEHLLGAGHPATRPAEGPSESPEPFLGSSAAIRELERTVRKVTRSDSTLLIQGETGTGKGVLARWLHRQGPRASGPFVDINCAGLSPELLESELFGHEKGAFTGAVGAKPGLLEIAHGGVFFLDELGEMSLAVQSRLLKVLEERRFRRMGDVRDRMVDIQLIAATHRNLADMVRQGTFRRDLYFRINTFPLPMPSLRERAEDIPVLASRMLEQIGPRTGKVGLTLEPVAVRALHGYGWPGNLRELRNVLERAALLCEGTVIAAGDLRFEGELEAQEAAPPPEEWNLAMVERNHIERALRAEGGNIPQAARRLGIPRSSLYDKLKRLGIEHTPDPQRRGSHEPVSN